MEKPESGKIEFLIRKKAYEISYALWRIAANMSQKSFADKIFAKSIEFIGYAADSDYSSMQRNVSGLEFLIRFGVGVDSVSVSNGEILLVEIGNLKSAIFDLSGQYSSDEPISKIDAREELDISSIFSDSIDAGVDGSKIELDDEYVELNDDPARRIDIPSPKAENRQSAILERIRQIGNCRLSDIQLVLPDCSERTIRYDLESLVQRNLIERVGTGGRSVYYKIR